jgi:hypothetical protein
MSHYKCSNCQLGVIVLDDEIIKACKCDAPIVAEMSATAKGEGGVK